MRLRSEHSTHGRVPRGLETGARPEKMTEEDITVCLPELF